MAKLIIATATAAQIAQTSTDIIHACVSTGTAVIA
jgi:hypothetical protein